MSCIAHDIGSSDKVRAHARIIGRGSDRHSQSTLWRFSSRTVDVVAKLSGRRARDWQSMRTGERNSRARQSVDVGLKRMEPASGKQ
jgi:hypothetical protein